MKRFFCRRQKQVNHAPIFALVGSPNSGKTSLFNTLTGSKQKVANYPGVTVEHKEGFFKAHNELGLRIIDLPGIYGATPNSNDEQVTWNVLLGKIGNQAIPDGIVIVADATRLESALSLALEIKLTNIPSILVLNKMDVAQRRGLRIDLEVLSRETGMPIVPCVAITEDGTKELKALLTGFLQGQAGLSHGPCSRCSETACSGSSFAYVHETRQKAKTILVAAAHEKPRPSINTRRVDNLLLHPVVGPVFLFTLLFFVFQAVFLWAETPMGLIDNCVTGLIELANSHMNDGILRRFLTNGLITSIGSVVIFLPQILILYAFILILEDSGYLARAAFLLDWIMGRIGLPGRALIPLLSSFACTVPGILAARTIENRRDRLVTILVAPLMTCSARLPVYALLISAFIPHKTVLGVFSLQGLVMFVLYLAGIIGGAVVSFVLKKTFFKGETAPLLLEMPNYQLPRLKNLLLGLFERAGVFLFRAGTIIFSISILIWFLASWPSPPEGATGAAIEYSFAGRLGHLLEPLFAPLGFDWPIVVSLIPTMLAREVFISSLATVYAVSAQTSDTLGLTLKSTWALPEALSVLAWFVFAPQCIAMLAVLKRETGSLKLTLAATFGYFFLAWVAAFATYNVAKSFAG